MSHISVSPLSADDSDLLESLLGLGISGPNQGIAKTSSTTFANVTFSGGGGGTWGSITGTLSNQTDLQSALNAKQVTLVSGTNIKTINSTSLLGSGNIVVTGTSPLTTKGDVYVYSTLDTRIAVGTDGQVLTAASGETTGLKWTTPPGTGDVVGPSSSVDNTIVRFDSTTGKLIQGYTSGGPTISDTGAITATQGGSLTGTWSDLGTVSTIDINGGTLDGTIIGGASAAAITGTAIIGNSFVPNSATIPLNGMYLPAAATLGWSIASAIELQLTGTALSPGADGGSSLGTTALGWQNLFANTGFVLNIENSDWVATHTAGILTVGTGDLRVTNAGTNTASAATVGGTQTLAAKTLTAPKFADGGFLADSTGAKLLLFDTDTLAVNYLGITNANTGTNPYLFANGSDSNVGFNFLAQGTGTFNFLGTSDVAATIRLYEDTDDGSNYTAFKVGTQAGNITYTLPTAVGAAGTQLTDVAGNGVLSWASAGGVPTTITVADESTDTTSFLAFFTAATGDLGPKTNTNMTFNASTGVVTFASSVLTTTDINGGTVDGAIIGGASAAAITGTTIQANTGFVPDANDGAYLGTTALAFSDLFLAEGGVINWDNGDATLTQTGDAIVWAGITSWSIGTSASATIGTIELGAASDTTIARSGAGAITVEGVQVILSGAALGTPSSGTGTNITGIPAANILAGSFGAGAYVISTSLQVATIELGHATDTTLARVSAGVVSIEGVNILTVAGGTLTGSLTLSENVGIYYDPAGSADGKYTSTELIIGTGGATIAFGDVVTLDKDDSRWELLDISVAAAATGDARGICGIAVTSSSDGAAITVMLRGVIRADANFPALTIGAAVFASTTGDIVVTEPTTTDHVIRVVGYALTADEIYFSPENDWTTHV